VDFRFQFILFEEYKKDGEIMKFLFLILALLMSVAEAQAELQKCISSSGKVTFTDSACPSNSSTSSIKIRDNTIDTAGMRQEALRLRDAEDDKNARENPPQECKFKSYKVNDEKGRILAENAQIECAKNLKVGKAGGVVSKDAYYLWKDHYDQTTQARQANLDRAAKFQAEVNKSNQKPLERNAVGGKEKLICKPNIMGTALECE
jgi:hypothetical protein